MILSANILRNIFHLDLKKFYCLCLPHFRSCYNKIPNKTKNDHAEGNYLTTINNNAHLEQDLERTIHISPFMRNLLNSFVYYDKHLANNRHQANYYPSSKQINVGHNLAISTLPIPSLPLVRDKWTNRVYQSSHYPEFYYHPPNHRLSLNDLLIRSYILNKK